MRIEQKLSIPLFLIVIGNILSIIIKKGVITDYILYVSPFMILIILLFFRIIKLNNTIVSISLLLFSCISMSTIHPSALNDILFLILSLYLAKNSNKVYWIYGTIYVTILLGRYIYSGSSELIVHLAGCSLVFILYQHYIHPKKSYIKGIEKDYLISPVKKEIVDIVYLIIQGCEYHEISDKLELNITSDRVRRKVNAEIKRLGFNNREHMIFFLTEKGIIKSISYDLDTKNKSHDIL